MFGNDILDDLLNGATAGVDSRRWKAMFGKGQRVKWVTDGKRYALWSPEKGIERPGFQTPEACADALIAKGG